MVTALRKARAAAARSGIQCAMQQGLLTSNEELLGDSRLDHAGKNGS